MILPHVGLVVLLIVYLLIGAIVFRYLEAPNELEVNFTILEKKAFSYYQDIYVESKKCSCTYALKY